MSIRSNIETVMSAIAGGNTALGDQVQEEAVAAIKGGQGSPEWETYMTRFSQSSAQLARLLATDDTFADSGMDLARTTLVGNGTCGATTTGFALIDGVDDKLDEDLS